MLYVKKLYVPIQGRMVGNACMNETSDTWRTLPCGTTKAESARQGPSLTRLINDNTRMHYINYLFTSNNDNNNFLDVLHGRCRP